MIFRSGLTAFQGNKEPTRKNIGMYNMKDDHIFGTILEECTFLKPLEFYRVDKYNQNKKLSPDNMPNDAADPDNLYEDISEDFPTIYMTMANCSYKKLLELI